MEQREPTPELISANRKETCITLVVRSRGTGYRAGGAEEGGGSDIEGFRDEGGGRHRRRLCIYALFLISSTMCISCMVELMERACRVGFPPLCRIYSTFNEQMFRPCHIVISSCGFSTRCRQIYVLPPTPSKLCQGHDECCRACIPSLTLYYRCCRTRP